MYDISARDIARIFTETKKWLWLCNEHAFDRKSKAIPRDLSIYSCYVVIDVMWHQFILFTREYQKFCTRGFGCFIHHEPEEASPPAPKYDFEKEFDCHLSYVYDKLGPDTVATWFEVFPAKYGAKSLARLRKQ
jgi:hypothetical protein